MIQRFAIRIVTIKEGKVLLISNDRDGFFYFIGGKMEEYETIEDCVKRELQEETSMDIEAKIIKPLYFQELIRPEHEKHKLEMFILVEIDKFEELEGIQDPEHNGDDHLTWIDIDKIPERAFPSVIFKQFKEDYKTNFKNHEFKFFENTIDFV